MAITIGQKAASVAADHQTKTYGDANPTLTATVAGTVNGDVLNYTLATTAGQFSNVASYPITVTLGTNGNYLVTPTNDTLRGPTIIGTESRVKPCRPGVPSAGGQRPTSVGVRLLVSARSAREDAITADDALISLDAFRIRVPTGPRRGSESLEGSRRGQVALPRFGVNPTPIVSVLPDRGKNLPGLSDPATIRTLAG